MSYVVGHVQDNSSYTPYMDAVFTTMSGAGWELHDDVSSTKKVYKSKGEHDSYCYGYMVASLESTDRIQLRVYQDWNATTHVGIGGAYNQTNYSRTTINYKPLIIYCTKNFVCLFNTGHTGNGSYVMCGMPEFVFDTTLTTTVSGISSGSDVVVPVVSTTGFLKNSRYKVIGVNYEGREVVTIGSIQDATHLVVETLHANYGIGTCIGAEPCPLMQANYPSDVYYSATGYASSASTHGTGDQGGYARIDVEDIVPRTFLDPAEEYSLYGLCTCQVLEQGCTPIGYFKNYWYIPPKAPPTPTAYNGIYLNGDIYVVNSQPIISVTSATAITATFIAAWSVNEVQDKIIVFYTGHVAGHTRKIISNTTDTVTVGVPFDIIPSNGDNAAICDEAYRPVQPDVCFKEII